MERAFGVGVVGAGDISRVYLGNLKKYPDIVRLAAVCDADAARAERASQTFDIPTIHSSVADLVADPEVDIVLCLTPPGAHAEVVLTALAAGKHAYTEKTLATTMADGRKVLEAAERAGLVVGCAPDTVLGSRVQEMRAQLDSGRIGRVIGGVATAVFPGLEWFHTSPVFYYGSDVGPVMDLAPYYFAALVTLLGPVRRVSAVGKRTYDRREIHSEPMKGGVIDVETDTHVTALIEFDDSVVVPLIISWDVWDSDMPRFELYGTEGTLTVPDPDGLDGLNLFGGPLSLRTRENARFIDFPRPEELPEAIDVPIDRPFSEVIHAVNSRGIGLVEMAYAIRAGRKPRMSADLALHVLEIASAILQSNAEGRFVELTTTCERPEALPANFPENERTS